MNEYSYRYDWLLGLRLVTLASKKVWALPVARIAYCLLSTKIRSIKLMIRYSKKLTFNKINE